MYDKQLTEKCNKFITDCWKKMYKGFLNKYEMSLSTCFMDQTTETNPDYPMPIGFHESSFVNTIGYYEFATGYKFAPQYFSKKIQNPNRVPSKQKTFSSKLRTVLEPSVFQLPL